MIFNCWKLSAIKIMHNAQTTGRKKDCSIILETLGRQKLLVRFDLFEIFQVGLLIP